MNAPLVSIGFPVWNGAGGLERVVEAVLGQDHPNVELVISDNASTDETEEMCRELARRDDRVVYHRNSENIGLLRNFQVAIDKASGEYFRWISENDWLAPSYVSTLLEPLLADDGLLLVTSGIEYELDDGSTVTTDYRRDDLESDDGARRFLEVLRLLTDGFSTIPDPLYGLMRREPVATIPRRNMLREDEVFAAQLALAGRWQHVEEVLARRGWSLDRMPAMTKKLDVPRHEAAIAWVVQGRALLGAIDDSDLDADQRRRARLGVARLLVTRFGHWLDRGARKAARLVRRSGTNGP